MPTCLHCRICVKGHLSSDWANWFSGLQVQNKPGGESVLSGPLPDQAALSGVLTRIWDMGLALVSVRCSETDVVYSDI